MPPGRAATTSASSRSRRSPSRTWGERSSSSSAPWIEGFILFGVGPARSALKRIGTLQLSGKNVASFSTFAVAPRGSMAKLRGALESRGASVVAERAFNRGRAKAEASAFANEVLSKI